MWEDLYEKYFPELKRYASAYCKNETAGEDAAQEVFLKALKNAHIFEDLGPSQRRAWLYATLKNELCDRFRRAKLEESFLQNIPLEESYLDPGIQKTETAILLAQLSKEDRALFHLRYEEDYTASELAEMFGVPSGTIRARLSRTRKLLKTMIE